MKARLVKNKFGISLLCIMRGSLTLNNNVTLQPDSRATSKGYTRTSKINVEYST
jgi:hypothetical protein